MERRNNLGITGIRIAGNCKENGMGRSLDGMYEFCEITEMTLL